MLTSIACSNFKTQKEGPLNAIQKGNFRLLVTLIKQGRAEESLSPIHPIKYGRSMRNVRRRAYKSGTSFNRQKAYWQTVCVNARGIRYVVESSTKLLKFQAAIAERQTVYVNTRRIRCVVACLLKFLNNSFAPYGYLLDLIKRAADDLITFQAVMENNSSSYSSAVEFSNSDRR